MKAIVIEAYGGPEVLQRHELEVPAPAAGEVLVQVSHAGINFMDIGTRKGRYAGSKTYRVTLPCTLGMEGAGEIVGLGAGVERLAVGDRVAWCIAWGSYADYAVVPACLVARLPVGIGDDVAAAGMFQGCTAHYLIEDVARLGPGARVLIHAASGAIGRLLVQMAKARGALVIATASSDEKRARARDAGADHVLGYGEHAAFADEVRELTRGDGVDVVFDAVGAPTLRGSLRATRKRGLVVSYGEVGGALGDFSPLELGEAGSLFLTRPRLADHMGDAVTVQRRADAVFGAVLDGKLRIDIAERCSMDQIPAAHARLEERRQLGKPILVL